VDGAALDRPGRTSATWIVRSSRFSGPRAQQALHLRAALDLEVADGVGRLDLRVDRLVVERDPREVDRLAAQARDLVDAVLDRGEHPEPEQVDLQEAGVGARVLVPLADLAPSIAAGLDGDELDERLDGDHHPARVLRDVPRQARRSRARARRARASGRSRGSPGRRATSSTTRWGLPVGDAGEPLELGDGRPRRLAEVADRPARVVGREGGDEARVLAAVRSVTRRSASRGCRAEVEVDVGHGASSRFRKRPEREVAPTGSTCDRPVR
jgi:hypothetical protein